MLSDHFRWFLSLVQPTRCGLVYSMGCVLSIGELGVKWFGDIVIGVAFFSL